MNLAPLPFLPHTHRKETRFPSNRAGYISVFLGIGVAHDIGDVDTGFILNFSECIRKVCKATKESFFSFQTIKHSSSTFFSIFSTHQEMSAFVTKKNIKKQNKPATSATGPRLVFTQHRSDVHKKSRRLCRTPRRTPGPKRTERRTFICHGWC